MLFFIGPTALPCVFRNIGPFVGKAKSTALDFSLALNAAADAACVTDAMDSVNSLKDGVRSVADPPTKWKDGVPGAAIGKLSDERAEKAQTMNEALAARAQQSMEAENMQKDARAQATPQPTPAKDNTPG